MGLADEMSADFLSIQDESQGFVFIGKTRYKALLSETSFAEQIELGGFAPSYSLNVKLLRRDCPKLPELGSLLLCEGQEYRICSITMNPTTPFVKLECQQK